MEKMLKRCDWCGEECGKRFPLENREESLPGLFAWVCEGCKEAMQSEHWCEAFSAPVVLGFQHQRPATLEVRQLTEFLEYVL